jgi:hypothetical protein
VLELLREGLTNREIAGQLGMSLKVAEYHVAEVIGRLGVRNRYEAAVWPERPPWWMVAVAPLKQFFGKAGEVLTPSVSSFALATSGASFGVVVGGMALIGVLVARSDGFDTGVLEAPVGPPLVNPSSPSAVCDMTATPGFSSCEAEIDFALWLEDQVESGNLQPGPFKGPDSAGAGIFLGDLDDRSCLSAHFEPHIIQVSDCQGNLIREVPRP